RVNFRPSGRRVVPLLLSPKRQNSESHDRSPRSTSSLSVAALMAGYVALNVDAISIVSGALMPPPLVGARAILGACEREQPRCALRLPVLPRLRRCKLPGR